ncbi:MAG: tRNA (adenine(22)-N(1))-methyltransferase TrmK [Blautia massiliensis (ex Durand et al. 2017)]
MRSMDICPSIFVSEKKVPSAIAMDVRPEPLSKAGKNISCYGLEDYIETRLSDGLMKLEPGEGDTLVDRRHGWSSDGKDIK